ncbi:TPA: hypothetical protein BOS_2865 [Bos taurus]|nr:TPA: hypothetical protein BOS_2865 [Bos taurus]
MGSSSPEGLRFAGRVRWRGEEKCFVSKEVAEDEILKVVHRVVVTCLSHRHLLQLVLQGVYKVAEAEAVVAEDAILAEVSGREGQLLGQRPSPGQPRQVVSLLSKLQRFT